jgi:hypothetical protein
MKKHLFSLRKLPCDCTEMPVIRVNRVVNTYIIIKTGRPRRRRGTKGH